MATSITPSDEQPSPLGYAGLASFGAGIIHLGIALGVATNDVLASLAMATSGIQILWGTWASRRPGRVGAVVGAAIAAGVLAWWAVAILAGFPNGREPTPILGFAEALAGGLTFVALVVSIRAIQVDPSPSAPRGGLVRLRPAAVAGLALCLLVAIVAAVRPGPGNDLASAVASPTLAASVDTRAENRLFDPADPIDLSGVPGVTANEQARAEALLASTLEALRGYSDQQAALDAGYQSLGDGFTGHEHFINWDLIDDGRELDPEHPESLVYEVDDDGSRTLAAALYILPTGTRLTTVPDVGGSLTPWHVRGNICASSDPDSPTSGGITNANGVCPDGQEILSPVPMLHVWVSEHPCGPFASLEGVAGLEVGPDEVIFCDHVHGA